MRKDRIALGGLGNEADLHGDLLEQIETEADLRLRREPLTIGSGRRRLHWREEAPAPHAGIGWGRSRRADQPFDRGRG